MRIAYIGDGLARPHSAEAVGSKAANLARMAALAIPVPPAFVVPIHLCPAIVAGDPRARQTLADGLSEGMRFLENKTGRRFGDKRRPLLVSVRSGAAKSMPGMLDTVLNVGCAPAAVHGLVRMTGNPRFAWDCRRRFLESFGGVVLGICKAAFTRRLSELVAAENLANEQALDGEALERLAVYYEQMIEDHGRTVPEEAVEQLDCAAQAVYRSWTSERARAYRQQQHLDDLVGTAVMVQAMMFGNRSHCSGSGVAFSRDPSTGAKEPVVEILFGSQGEDVVSGSHNPETEEAIARLAPDTVNQLREILARLEREFGDVQDVEFTIEEGSLWILQSRPAKRTRQAALRFAIDFVEEGLIKPAEALRRLDGLELENLATMRLVNAPEPATRGTGASAGIAVGRAAFDSGSAERLAAGGGPVILVRPDTSTADVAGFAAAAGIVTAVGGQTAHAALVARQMGKPCIVGCAALTVDAESRSAQIAGTRIKEEDWLSIDAGQGTIYLGQCEITVERPEAELAEVQRWRAELVRES